VTRPRLQALLQRGGERVATLSAHGPVRPVALRAIQAALPRRFDPERARDLDATIELRLHDGNGRVRQLTLRIDHGNLTVTPGAAPDATAVAQVQAEDTIRLAAGVIGWPELISSGRMEFSGDPFLALRFPLLFRLPPS
jgi:alkyl sulfatase BDS1-like metallo-beta-lactamase superfamily hydrolase